MEVFAAILAAALVGAFIQGEGRKRQKQLDEINRKLDLLLSTSAPAAADESSV